MILRRKLGCATVIKRKSRFAIRFRKRQTAKADQNPDDTPSSTPTGASSVQFDIRPAAEAYLVAKNENKP